MQYKTIDQYIETFPPEMIVKLSKLRETITKVAPDATEAIKYGMPTYVLNKNLAHFAGCKNHVGFYPSPSGIENFKEELSQYKTSKGAIQFPNDQKISYELVKKILEFRVMEDKTSSKDFQ